ncbi:MAG: ABC transporter permease [Desulfobacterales bacterium]|nr:MAG: ABC transporter permease [Desulfobacterales bacterium]
MRNPKALFGSTVVVIFTLVAILAPLLAPHDPNKQILSNRLKPPVWTEKGTWDYPLGTDALGRDLLSRLIFGSRVSLIVGFFGALACVVVGLPLAVLAGYFRGWVDEVIMRIADVFLSIPGLLLAIALVALLDPTIFSVTFTFTLASWAWATRVIRSQVLKIREMEFVEAAKAVGAGHLYIMVRHVVPNTFAITIVFAALYVAIIILYEASLSFLGFSASDTSWGWDLAKGKEYISTAWWISTFSGFSIFCVVLALNFLGDWLRDYFDVRLD